LLRLVVRPRIVAVRRDEQVGALGQTEPRVGGGLQKRVLRRRVERRDPKHDVVPRERARAPAATQHAIAPRRLRRGGDDARAVWHGGVLPAHLLLGAWAADGGRAGAPRSGVGVAAQGRVAQIVEFDARAVNR